MTPVNLVRHNSLELPHAGDGIDDSLSMDTQDITDQPAFSITEIGVSKKIGNLLLLFKINSDYDLNITPNFCKLFEFVH